jgi:hypothetical protein
MRHGGATQRVASQHDRLPGAIAKLAHRRDDRLVALRLRDASVR